MNNDGIFLVIVLAAMMAAMIVTACGDGGEVAESQEVPGLVQLTEEIFEPGCAHAACHGGDQGIAGLAFADPEITHAQLVGAAPVNGPARNDGMLRVTEGDVDSSFLWAKLTMSPEELAHRGYGEAMPMGTHMVPGPASMEAIRQWIEGGVPLEGVSFEADMVHAEDFENYVECEADDPAGLQACFPRPLGEQEGLRLYSPPLEIPPNSDTTLCSYLDFFADEDILLTETRGLQMHGGHHIAVFVANSPSSKLEPGPCTDEEMMNYRYVAAGGGGGGLDTVMPQGVGLRISEGQQVVVQSHYINTSDEPMVVMDAVDIVYAPGEVDVVADPFAMIDGDFEIPPNAQDFRRVSECSVEEPMEIFMLLGHTHQYGVLFEFELLVDGEEPELLYQAFDGRMLRNTPEIKMYDPPLQIEAGDTFRLTCGWDNPYDRPLSWPEEMCVALMYYGPGQGWLTCESDQDHPRVLGGESDGPGCADEGDPGNEFGVGRHCTDGGGQCSGNSDAEFCLAAFDAASNFCSFLGCDTDEECGDGAQCVSQTLGSACVPSKCLE